MNLKTEKDSPDALPSMEKPSSWWHKIFQPTQAIWVCVLITVLTLVAFWPVLHSKFIDYDDQDYVTSNPQVLAGLTWDGVVWAFRTFHASNWHPLTWLSHMLDVTMFGRGPTGPHCVNLLLHLANSVLLFLLLRRMTKAHWRSAVVAALFALHPLHVESVAWVAERKDVLSTFFWMLTLLAYVEYVARTKAQSGRGGFYYGLALVFFTLGLMSKPMLVTLPLVLLLLDYWPLQRFQLGIIKRQPSTIWPLVREKLPFFFLTILACVATLMAQRNSIQPLWNLPIGDRIENALVSYVRYLGKTFWPVGLAVPYPHVREWPLESVMLAAVVLAGLCIGAVWAGRRWPFVGIGWLWFLVTLVPVIGLLQVGIQSMADRYTYVPLIGIFIVVVWGGTALAGSRRGVKVAIGVGAVFIVAACGVRARQQAGYWQNSERLFRHAAAVTDGNYVALTTIGVSLFHQGKLEEAEDYCRRAIVINASYADALNNLGVVLAAKRSDEAMLWYRKALQVNPSHNGALYNLGNELASRGQYGEAISCFEAVLRVRPDHFEARNNLANALVAVGRIEEAIEQYRSALELQPRDLTVQKNLAAALVKRGKFDQAIPLYRLAIKVSPNNASTHYALGLILALQKEWDEAIQEYRKTVELWPNYDEAEYNLGYALRVQGKLDEAALHLERALQLRPNFPLAHYNLGCVLAADGKRDAAIAHVREAWRLDPTYQAAKQKLEELEKQTNTVAPK